VGGEVVRENLTREAEEDEGEDKMAGEEDAVSRETVGATQGVLTDRHWRRAVCAMVAGCLKGRVSRGCGRERKKGERTFSTTSAEETGCRPGSSASFDEDDEEPKKVREVRKESMSKVDEGGRVRRRAEEDLEEGWEEVV
jgi:hypothetical protein